MYIVIMSSACRGQQRPERKVSCMAFVHERAHSTKEVCVSSCT